MERDVQLDCYRALTMIYIVCFIHIIYWFPVCNESIRSVTLFEMPAIFFIAGASQSYKNKVSLLNTIYNRFKRVLLPYYIFIAFLYIFYYVCTEANIKFGETAIDISELDATDILKTLITGGSTKIPYFGYTWFISCYLIISCSLPLQIRILERMSKHLYVFAILSLFILFRLSGIETYEEILERVLCYNFFYIIGYVYYRKINIKHLAIISAFSVVMSAYLILSGKIFPMQHHKFPPDAIFLAYCLSIICISGLIFSNIKIKYNYFMKLWNTRGYTIYLYQSISHFLLYKATESWITMIDNKLAAFTIYFILIVLITTALSYITYPAEQYIIKRLTNLKLNTK